MSMPIKNKESTKSWQNIEKNRLPQRVCAVPAGGLRLNPDN